MKNTLLKRALVLLPLLVGGIVISCQDETADRVAVEVKNATIEKAKAIFEQKSPDFPVIQSRSTKGVEKGIVFEPVWDEAFVAKHNDGSTTVETHIRLSQPFHMLPQDSREAYERTKDSRYLQHLSRAVVLMQKEEDSEPLAFLMTIVGSKKYMEEHDFQLWEVSYLAIPEDFSGMVFYHTLAGNFINGWYVEEGRQFSTCEPISDEEANILSRAVSTGEKVACKTIALTRHYYMCPNVNNTDDIFAIYELNNVPSNIAAYCTGPYTKVENYQICSVVDDSYLSTTGNSGPVIPYVDLTKLFGNYSNNLYAQLQGFMNFMEHNDDVSRAVLDYVDFVESASPGVFNKLNVQIDTTQTTDVRYSDSSNTVFFKSVDHYSDLTMYEEVVHALQRVVYADYSEIPFNIEFEAKLIIDYMDFVNDYEGNTDMALNMQYLTAELSDGSTKTLAQWIRANAYSNLGYEDYYVFLNLWKTVAYDYRNYMLGLRAYPRLIGEIIEEINNN